MVNKRYRLYRSDMAERLEIISIINFREVDVRLDGKRLGVFTSRSEVQTGKSFPIERGQTLQVFLARGRLRVYRNMLPIPRSPGDEAIYFQIARLFIAFLVFVAVLFALLTFNFRSYGNDGTLVIGVTVAATFLLVGLAVWAWSGNRFAFYIHIGLATPFLLFSLSSGDYLFPILYLFVMGRGLAGIKALEEERFADQMIALKHDMNATPEPASGKTVPVTPIAPIIPITTVEFYAPLSADNLKPGEESLAVPALDVRQDEAVVRSEDKLRRAIEMITAHQSENAKKLIVEVLRSEPQNGRAWYLTSFVLNDRAAQIDALQKAIQFAPELSQARDRLATLLGIPTN